MSDALADACGMLRGLIEKREAAAARRAKIKAERAAIAYQAHAGDQKAKKRLSGELRDRADDADRELEDLDAAIATAKTRVFEAEQASEAAAMRGLERQARQLGEQLEADAAAVDKALAEAARAILAARATALELTRLGGKFADGGARLVFSQRLLELAIDRAMSAALQPALRGISSIPVLPPAQRRPLLAQIRPALNTLKAVGTGPQTAGPSAPRGRPQAVDAEVAAVIAEQRASDADDERTIQ